MINWQPFDETNLKPWQSEFLVFIDQSKEGRPPIYAIAQTNGNSELFLTSHNSAILKYGTVTHYSDLNEPERLQYVQRA